MTGYKADRRALHAKTGEKPPPCFVRAGLAAQDRPIPPRERKLLRLTLGPRQQPGYVAAVSPKELPEGRRLGLSHRGRRLGRAPAAVALGDGDRPPGFKDRGFPT
jgi:hypothetical protein